MPTKERTQRALAKLISDSQEGKFLKLGTLANIRLTTDVLQSFPKLLDKNQPDVETWADVVSWEYDRDRKVLAYRIRTIDDVAKGGEAAYPSAFLSLSEVRLAYVALPQ
jgi:hypothetical protein